MSRHPDLERELSAQLGMPVIVDPRVPKGKMYLVPDWPPEMGLTEFGTRMYEYPTSIKGEAVKIVQDGLADIVEYLRRMGHPMPSWQEQERMDQVQWFSGWRRDEQVGMSIINPRQIVRITS